MGFGIYRPLHFAFSTLIFTFAPQHGQSYSFSPINREYHAGKRT
ncbi:MAG: hypothetical protein WC391_02445 [Methanoregula sp.]